MSDRKYVPDNVFLKCDKGVAPCQLKIVRPGPELYDEKWAVESDAVPMLNIHPFGVCAITHSPCVPATVRWQNTLMGAMQVDAGGMPQNPLVDNSFLPCALGGKIDIFFTRASVVAALQTPAAGQAAPSPEQQDTAHQLSADMKTASTLLLGAAILAGVVGAAAIVLTGGLATPLVIGAATAALEVVATGALVGAAVGATAGAVHGYAEHGSEGIAAGALEGATAGTALGAGAGLATATGGLAGAVLLGASGATFGIASAADAVSFYKKPTLANGLVLVEDAVILAGGRLIEGLGKSKGAKELETTSGGKKEQCTGVDEPIDVASGAMFFDSVDFTLPGPVPVVWERTYYSTSERRGPLGYGWHHCYDLALWPDVAAGTVAMRLADGRLAEFEAPTPANDYYSYHRARKLELRPAPAGADGYHVHSVAERCTYHFAPSAARPGQYALAAIADAYDHAIRFDYNDHGHLRGLTDSVGRWVGIETDAHGRMLRVSLPDPDQADARLLVMQYAYDEAGHLISTTDAEGHRRHFAFDGHRLVRKTFAEGTSYYYEYDGQGRCTRTWGDENYYNGRLVYEPGCTTHYADDPAAVNVYYHEQGLVTTHVNALGAQHHWRYNAHAELEAEQDALGHTTRYDYDARGNCIAVTYPDGASEQTDYDEHDRPVAATDANGGTWQWMYDEYGRLAQRLDPLGAPTHYRYNEHGLLAALVDAQGYTTHLRYDAQLNLAHFVDPADHVRSRAYDALGRLVELTDPLGQRQQRRYDRRGQLVELREPDGRTSRLRYDGEGNVVHVHDGTQEVAFAYTAVNRLAERRQAGQAVRFAYDRQARLLELRNEDDRPYRFGLDAAGRVVEEVGFDGLTRRYERDAAGRVVQVLRPAGRATRYAYDARGQVLSVAHDQEPVRHYAYDASGALREARVGEQRVAFERDARGRVLAEQQGVHTVRSTFDVRGQRTSLRSTLGAALNWQHDALGRLTRVQAQVEHAAQPTGPSWQATLGYDARGLELQRTLSGGLRLAWQRDALGRPTAQRLSGGGSAWQRRYHWQGADQLAAIDDEFAGLTRYAYDARGFLTEASYGDGTPELRRPDAVGNLFRAPALDDRTYAPGGQLRQAGGTRYRYDAEGNLVLKTTADRQTWHYSWDGAGQLTSVRRPDGYAATFDYDALGRRVSKRFRGRITRWVWDGDKPLHEWCELEVGPGAGAVHDLTTWLFEEDSFAPAAKLTAGGAQSVVCDHLGTPLSLFDAQGEETWRARLDSYGAVRQGLGKAQDCPFRYQGQYEDVETGLYYNRFRYYDPEIGQYISQDPARVLGGIKPYSYVADTNSWIDELGLACAQVKNGVLEIKQKFPAGSPEAKELESFAQEWNREMANAGGSYTRQAVPKSVRRAASKAAKAEKAANPSLYGNGEVAGHTPDVGWGGLTTGPFTPLSPEVNAYVGGATQAIPVGTTYTSVIIVP